MPAVALFFEDPDGHLLEFIAMLPDKPRPDVGSVSWEEWNRINASIGNAG
jgi:lactoylglutathione lyase